MGGEEKAIRNSNSFGRILIALEANKHKYKSSAQHSAALLFRSPTIVQLGLSSAGLEGTQDYSHTVLPLFLGADRRIHLLNLLNHSTTPLADWSFAHTMTNMDPSGYNRLSKLDLFAPAFSSARSARVANP